MPPLRVQSNRGLMADGGRFPGSPGGDKRASRLEQSLAEIRRKFPESQYTTEDILVLLLQENKDLGEKLEEKDKELEEKGKELEEKGKELEEIEVKRQLLADEMEALKSQMADVVAELEFAEAYGVSRSAHALVDALAPAPCSVDEILGDLFDDGGDAAEKANDICRTWSQVPLPAAAADEQKA